MQFSELLGMTITEWKGGVGDDEIVITTDSGRKFRMYHMQDCCEYVRVEDIIGDVNDLLNSPLFMAEEVTNATEYLDNLRGSGADSSTWTFYKLATANGYVTIRWLGESNGYYSESVDFEEV